MLNAFCICTLHIFSALLMPVLVIPDYDPEAYPPPPPPLPTATITPKGVLYLSKPFMAALKLHNGQVAGLVPPEPGQEYWHLDLRPTAPNRITWSGSTSQPRRAQSARIRGIELPAGLLAQNLTLHLIPVQPHHPHYYRLLPANAIITQTTAPPLAA